MDTRKNEKLSFYYNFKNPQQDELSRLGKEKLDEFWQKGLKDNGEFLVYEYAFLSPNCERSIGYDYETFESLEGIFEWIISMIWNGMDTKRFLPKHFKKEENVWLEVNDYGFSISIGETYGFNYGTWVIIPKSEVPKYIESVILSEFNNSATDTRIGHNYGSWLFVPQDKITILDYISKITLEEYRIARSAKKGGI